MGWAGRWYWDTTQAGHVNTARRHVQAGIQGRYKVTTIRREGKGTRHKGVQGAHTGCPQGAHTHTHHYCRNGAYGRQWSSTSQVVVVWLGIVYGSQQEGRKAGKRPQRHGTHVGNMGKGVGKWEPNGEGRSVVAGR